jgi:uncharacterized protein YcbX
MAKSKTERREEMTVMLHVLSARSDAAHDAETWNKVAAVAGQIQRCAKALAEYAAVDAQLAQADREEQARLDGILAAKNKGHTITCAACGSTYTAAKGSDVHRRMLEGQCGACGRTGQVSCDGEPVTL